MERWKNGKREALLYHLSFFIYQPTVTDRVEEKMEILK